MEEKGYDEQTGKVIVAVDPRYFRPTEVETLLGDPRKAREKLGWEPKWSVLTWKTPSGMNYAKPMDSRPLITMNR